MSADSAIFLLEGDLHGLLGWEKTGCGEITPAQVSDLIREFEKAIEVIENGTAHFHKPLIESVAQRHFNRYLTKGRTEQRTILATLETNAPSPDAQPFASELLEFINKEIDSRQRVNASFHYADIHTLQEKARVLMNILTHEGNRPLTPSELELLSTSKRI